MLLPIIPYSPIFFNPNVAHRPRARKLPVSLDLSFSVRYNDWEKKRHRLLVIAHAISLKYRAVNAGAKT
jgi:hypothetical protein